MMHNDRLRGKCNNMMVREKLVFKNWAENVKYIKMNADKVLYDIHFSPSIMQTLWEMQKYSSFVSPPNIFLKALLMP